MFEIFIKILSSLILSSVVLGGEISQEYVRSNNELAIRLLEELPSDGKGNVVFSAFAIETVLGLISQGAKGETAEEIKNVLRLPPSDEKLKQEFQNLYVQINKASDDVSILSANRIYLQEGSQIKADFNTLASNIFKAGIQNINFASSEIASKEINRWVENNTNNKIKDLIRQDQLTDQTKIVLVNALYFKGNWVLPADPEKTVKKNFHVSNNETVQVDTMVFEGNLSIHRMKHHKTVFLRMFYSEDKRTSLTIVVPEDNDKLVGMQKRLRKAVSDQAYGEEYAKIYLPKFRLENQVDLKPFLEKMGIKKLFSKPDLSGITEEDVAVDSVNQKVFIDVDESGTEAASGTAAIASKRILLVQKQVPTEYHVDRPFFFCLQYDEVALLTGKIINPLKD